MGRIEHYRNVCRDLDTRLMKESEKFDEAVARKSALQDEINEIEAPIAEDLPQWYKKPFPLLYADGE